MSALPYGTQEMVEEAVERYHSFHGPPEGVCHVYKIRWLMLAIYMLVALADEMHWLHYAITDQSVVHYYGITDYIVDLTATMYGITFVVFVFPAIWLIEKYGLKAMLICGDLMIIAAGILKLGSLNPQHFYIGFVGQILAGIAQVFIVNVPSFLAGLWFPKNEVSTACALGVLGLQIGNALSFFIPPRLITLGQSSAPGEAGYKQGMLYVYIYLVVLPVVLLPLLIFVFKSEPKKAPSPARRLSIASEGASRKTTDVVKQLAKNWNYIFVVLSYSLNVSVLYCMSTLMNQVIKDEKFAGLVGATIVVCGIFGCLFLGWILDKTHKFKLSCLVTYVVSILGLIIFWANRIWAKSDEVFIISAVVLGFFLASYVIIAIEFSTELTYPISETISTSILLASGEFLSIIFIYVTAALFEKYGAGSAAAATLTFMVIGLLPTALPKNYRLHRHEASHGPFHHQSHHQHQQLQQSTPTQLSDNKEPKNDRSKPSESNDPRDERSKPSESNEPRDDRSKSIESNKSKKDRSKSIESNKSKKDRSKSIESNKSKNNQPK